MIDVLCNNYDKVGIVIKVYLMKLMYTYLITILIS